MAILNFDASKVETVENDYTPLPVGEYKAVITASEVCETKSNPDNKYLKFTFEVIDGKYKGRKLFENLNLWRDGSSKKDDITMRIAQSNLAQMCRAVGMTSINNSEELHNKPLVIKVKVTPASADYGEGNAITAYKSLNGGNTLANAAPVPKTQAMPWEK
jgi:hypothetical protein